MTVLGDGRRAGRWAREFVALTKKAPDDDRGMGKIHSYERCGVEIITPVSSSNTDTDLSIPCCDYALLRLGWCRMRSP
ncbi:hypothetical protein HCU01_05910 [Halomonas cupida]|uniref:Uncharacterized protein n=1 Tax=Halomonas cupida TaxID=44933 RepID=A0ABQ0WCG6_9GAMM|nr:hypothetical protein HCU01_05910 [Halomonas cupida]